MTHKHLMRRIRRLEKVHTDEVWRMAETWKCKYCSFTSMKPVK